MDDDDHALAGIIQETIDIGFENFEGHCANDHIACCCSKSCVERTMLGQR